jgi:Cys-tRNA(Pro) deacylase
MAKKEYPVTPAVRFLRAKKIKFKPHLHTYQEHGGALHTAQELDVPEHLVVKTLIMETDAGEPLIILMHGGQQVSTKQLARDLGVKRVTPCEPAQAQKYTGYQVGGISPFGTRKAMPVYVEASILTLDKIFINGGKRGFMVEINPQVLQKVLPVQGVSVSI